MSVIIPLEVKTEKELDRAVKLGRTVIIINNDEFYNKVCNKKKGKCGDYVYEGGFYLSFKGSGKLKKYGATIDKINKKCILIKHKGVGWFEDGDVIEGYSNVKCTSIKKAVKLDKEEDFVFYMKMKSACIIVEGDLYKKFKLVNYEWSKRFTDTKWIIDDEEKMRLYYFNFHVFDMNKDKIEGIDTDELFLHKPLFNNMSILGKEV